MGKEVKPLPNATSSPIADLVPSNWLDPLLTGPDAVLQGYSYTPADIERLLNAVRARIIAATTSEAV